MQTTRPCHPRPKYWMARHPNRSRAHSRGSSRAALTGTRAACAAFPTWRGTSPPTSTSQVQRLCCCSLSALHTTRAPVKALVPCEAPDPGPSSGRCERLPQSVSLPSLSTHPPCLVSLARSASARDLPSPAGRLAAGHPGAAPSPAGGARLRAAGRGRPRRQRCQRPA